MHTVKLGDKFNLLDMEWTVTNVHSVWFRAHAPDKGDITRFIDLHIDNADSLNWLKPKKKVYEFMEWFDYDVKLSDLKQKLIQLFGDV